MIDEFTCRKCPDGWWPYPNKSGCYPLPEQYMRWDSVYAIVPVVTSLIGIILTLFVIHTLVKYIDTPIVKASGRELSFILLAGILFNFLMTFALLAKPSIIICSLQRFGVSVKQSNFPPPSFLLFTHSWQLHLHPHPHAHPHSHTYTETHIYTLIPAISIFIFIVDLMFIPFFSLLLNTFNPLPLLFCPYFLPLLCFVSCFLLFTGPHELVDQKAHYS